MPADTTGTIDIQARIDDLKKELDRARRELEQVGDAGEQGFERVEAAVNRAESRLNRFRDGVATTLEAFERVAGAVRSLGEAFVESLDPAQLAAFNAELDESQKAIRTLRAEFVAGFADEVTGAMRAGTEEASRFTREIRVAGEVVGGLLRIVGGLAKVIAGTLGSALGQAAEFFLTLTRVVLAFGEAVTSVIPFMDGFSEHIGGIKDDVDLLRDAADEFTSESIDDLKGGLDLLRSSFDGVGDGARDFTGALDGAVPSLEKTADGAGKAAGAVEELGEAVETAADTVSDAATEIEERFAAALERVRDISSELSASLAELRQSQSDVGQASSEEADEVDELRKRREELLALDVISLEQSEELAEVTRKLGTALQESRDGLDLFADSSERAAAQMERFSALQDLAGGAISGTRAAIAQLSQDLGGLGDNSRRELDALIQGLEMSARAGTVTADQIEAFGFRVQAALGRARLETQRTTTAQQELQDESASLEESFRQHEAALADQGTALAETTEKTRELAEAHDEVAAALEAVEEKTPAESAKAWAEETETLNSKLSTTVELLEKIQAVTTAIDRV